MVERKDAGTATRVIGGNNTGGDMRDRTHLVIDAAPEGAGRVVGNGAVEDVGYTGLGKHAAAGSTGAVMDDFRAVQRESGPVVQHPTAGHTRAVLYGHPCDGYAETPGADMEHTA